MSDFLPIPFEMSDFSLRTTLLEIKFKKSLEFEIKRICFSNTYVKYSSELLETSGLFIGKSIVDVLFISRKIFDCESMQFSPHSGKQFAHGSSDANDAKK